MHAHHGQHGHLANGDARDHDMANREHFNRMASSYTNEASLAMAAACAGVMRDVYEFDDESTDVLDFACGPGLVSQALAADTRSILGVDSSEAMVELFNRQVDNHGIDREEMQACTTDVFNDPNSPLADRLFDVAVCTNAYHHFSSPATVTADLVRRLRPGGSLLVVDFVRDEEGASTAFTMHAAEGTIAHHGGFTPAEFEGILKSCADVEWVQVEPAFEVRRSRILAMKGGERLASRLQGPGDPALKWQIGHAVKSARETTPRA